MSTDKDGNERLFSTKDSPAIAESTGMTAARVDQATKHLLMHGWLLPTGIPDRFEMTIGTDCPGWLRCPLWEPE